MEALRTVKWIVKMLALESKNSENAIASHHLTSFALFSSPADWLNVVMRVYIPDLYFNYLSTFFSLT